MHGDIHRFVGSVNGTHFNPLVGEPIADPLFALFHSFLDYVRLLRQDCYQFDMVAADALDDRMPYSFEVINTTLDYKMAFGAFTLKKETPEMK